MLDKNRYSIDYTTLKSGEYQYDFVLDGELFTELESNEVKDAACKAHVFLTVSSSTLLIKVNVVGTAVVECDRCLEDCVVPVEYEGEITAFLNSEESEYDGEKFCLQHNEPLDLKQYLYESVVIALPSRRIHPEGECNPDMMARFTPCD